VSSFVKIFRFLNPRFPPSSTEYHNPSRLLETVQLTQVVNPASENLDVPFLFSVDGGALSGIVQGEFVSEDATPSGVFGVAMVLWAAGIFHLAGPAANPNFFLEDQTGTIRIPIGQRLALAANSEIGLSAIAGGCLPFIVPHKYRLVAIAPELSTFRLRYVRTVIQRGEQLPYF